MKYVYILESERGSHFYVGVTSNLKARVRLHNAGKVNHTAKHAPWKIRTYIAFSDGDRTMEFERYLKSGSGRAFAEKRF